MALASLLQRQAVLHLAGSDVLLPSVNSVAEEELSETEKNVSKTRQNWKALQSRFKRPGVASASLESSLGLLSGTSSSSSRGAASQSSSVQQLLGQLSNAVGRGGATASKAAPTLAMLEETLAIGATLLGRWAHEAPSGKVPLVARAVQECYQWMQHLSKLSSAGGDQKQRQQKLLEFLSQLTARIKELPAGGLIMVPAGWLRRQSTEGEGDDGGHFVLLILVRHLSDEDFTVAVVNSGEGLQYHPVKPSGAIPRPELPARQCPMVLVNVPRARITCGTFWYLLCRQIAHPSTSNSAQFLYATLLPMLNKQPLAANFGKEPSGWVQFNPLPVAGDGSFMLCFMWAVRFCLRASGVSDEGAAWSVVQLRRYVVDSIGHALDSQGDSPVDMGDLAIVRTAASSLARAAGEHVDRFGENARGAELAQLQDLVRKVHQSASRLEMVVRDAHSLLPPACAPEVVSCVRESSELRFGDFQRLLPENVEMLKGEVDPPRVLISVPTSTMPLAVKDPFEAADCCRLASHLLTLLSNQAEHLAQSAVARFALITRLMTQLLPMPLPLSHPQKDIRCFWMQDMKQETKTDLMRQLHLIARHFAAVCFVLKASRETDGARVVVSAAIAAVMDALLRRPFANTLHTSLVTSHYAGHAEGPSLPFGIDPGPLREASETLLLVAPEYQALRALVLDYFESVRNVLRDDHIVLSFDKDLSCSAGDYALIEQIGLCLGLDGARREAPLLLSGERPEILELFPELGWFRDVVFLWKMLLLPASASPAEQNWRSSDTSLRWMWKSGRFEVHGFGSTKLSPEALLSKEQNFIQGVLRWFGQYSSEDKSLSRASPSVLLGTGVALNSEDDVLFENQLPTFNGALGLADSELLLSYLTAPYLRIPLLLNFFTDRNRVSALRESQLQAVLDAALFEPGQWQPSCDANKAPPDLVPAPDRRHLATPAGLLFNELTRAPKPVVQAVRCMLQVAVEKDVGRPDSGNQGFILYIIRLAIRIESYLFFIIEHGRRGAYLERSGASYEAFVRGLAGQQDSMLLAELQDCHAQLRMELKGDVYRMLSGWVEYAASRGDKFLEAACRVHAHLALLFKNVPSDKLSVCAVSSFLSAQVFLNMNHRWLGEPAAESPSQDVPSDSTALRLGVGEVELFDAFESRRSRIVSWIRENVDDANRVFRIVERTVAPSGLGRDGDQKNQWTELRDKGNFVPTEQVPPSGWFAAQPGETFRQWLLRTTQGMPGTGGRQISVNLGQYGAKRDGLELLPTWAVRSRDYLEAIGRTDAHCTEREAAAHRVWKDLVSDDGFSIQRWAPDNRGPEGDAHGKAWFSGRVYRPENLSSAQAWIHQVLGPVQDAVPKLQGLELRLSCNVPTEADSEIWMGAIAASRRADQEETIGSHQLLEVRVQRQPPVVEVYNVIEHGRQFYRSLCFSSDTAWSFHSPFSNQLLLQNHHSASWSVAAGDIINTELSHSVVVLRSLPGQVGRQTHVPKRFLHGLLPDALLQRYRFWRCDNARAFPGAQGKIVAEEMQQRDSPTCLQITIEQESSKAAAKVQRFELPKGAAAAGHLENEGSLTLINLRRAPSSLTHILARLEDLSHILAWAAPDGKVCLVEMPRLRLSFTAIGGRLHCEQHHGFWFADRACNERVGRLLCQWGGGTALLENSSGELRVLVSALAEPIRPANGPFVDGFLPTRLALRRGSEAWVANLAEGSRHYYYALHVSGTFAFSPTPAAGLYLLICRFLSWNFVEAAAMASTLSEISSSEEKQLWDRLYLLASAHHPDAAACCLRLALATGPFRSTGKGWDTGHILLEYVRKMHLLTANCQLTTEEELQLVESQVQKSQAGEVMLDSRPTTVSQLPELAMRRAALQQLLSLDPAKSGRLELPAQLGSILEDDGFDRICDKTFMAEVGLLDRISATFTDVTYNRPQEARMQGHQAIGFLESLFSSFDGSLPSPNYPLLYEFFTGTLVLEVVVGDDSNAAASSLLRISCRDASKNASLSVLRALELNSEVCKVMPKWGSSDSSWSFGIGVLKVDTQSTSKLFEAAGQKLKSLERSLAWPRSFPSTPLVPKSITTEVHVGKYLWSAVLTGDVLCKSRSLGASLAKNFGGRPLHEMAAKFTSMEKAGGDALSQGMTAALKALDVCKQSPTAGSTEDQLMLDRLWNELKRISQEPAELCNLGSTAKLDSRVPALAKDLEKQRTQDSRAVEEAVEAAVELANRGSSSDWLRRAGGLRPQLSFSSLVAALMADEPGASAALRKVNASLSVDDDIPKLREIIAEVLLTTVRVGQVARVQQCLEQLYEERSQGSSEQVLALRARAVAAELGASRHFVLNVRPSSSEKSRSQQAVYDPRLLVFEFLCNIILRESQVVLLQAFLSKVQAGLSVCQQMIMGEGKTTVIAPLLVLLLADSEKLVCACTPPALLGMSRAVMAERFSSPVLPRPVLTFSFHRQMTVTSSLVAKLNAARRGRAAVLAAPASIKSVLLRRLELMLELTDMQKAHGNTQTQSDLDKQNSWLRFPSWLSLKATSSKECDTAVQISNKATEICLCGEVMKLFHGGVMMLDEVDLLLDPLRSELNWPLGRRYPLDLSGPGGVSGKGTSRQNRSVRYTLPFNLLDAVFAAATGCPEIAPTATRRDAQIALGALAEAIKIGRRELKVQVTPHFVLLSREFYMEAMLPHLADWAAVLVEEHLEGRLAFTDLKSVLRRVSPDSPVRQQLRTASQQALKTLNLTIRWLHDLMPYLLSKVHRVSYGLLTGRDLDVACHDAATPMSRKLLAVPFVGKDAPGASAEFSDPDVTIGFTILAYRLNGLRERDATALLKVLLEEMRAENTVRYHRRAACKAYVAMITNAGGRVRGFTEDGKWLGDLKDEEQRRRSEAMSRGVSRGVSRGGKAYEPEDRRQDVWPLELLDLADPDQARLVFDVLRLSPLAIRHLLEHHSFLAGTLDRNETQLTASGQELAGPQLFGRCLGFSGTPNNLLPRPMGTCIYAAGDDGKILRTLSNTQTVVVVELESWTPQSILKLVAKSRAADNKRPKYHAFIDSGALVTGMTNREVAEFLLREGLEGLHGVLYLNEKDERVVLERDSFRIVELAQCGLRPEQRFTFYDHVHTTGMDVKQPLLSTACLTLSKDMTFRDYSQGAYRMRGIGRGQQIELLVIPEVLALMHKSLSKAEGITENARATSMAALKKKPEAWKQRLVVDVISWLLLNGIRAEDSKRQLLREQDLRNVWRGAACQCFVNSPPDASSMETWVGKDRTKNALGELVTQIDFSVSADVPGEPQQSSAQRLRVEASQHLGSGRVGQSIWMTEAARDVARTEAEQILALLERKTPASVDGSCGDLGLCSEQVQEQEQEQQEEQEEDHEQQAELEEEIDKVPEFASEQKYVRDCEEATGWPIRNLMGQLSATTTGVPFGLPFYPLAEFAVNKGILNESCSPLAGLPEWVMLSENYYRHTWRFSSVRRLRNVMCFVEFVPSVQHLQRITVSPGLLSEEQRARLKEALEFCGGARDDCSAGLGRDEVHALCRVLDLHEEGDAFVAGMSAGSRVSLQQLEREVSSKSMFKMQKGRFFVAISLREAEHLRASMHLMKPGTAWSSDFGLALRCVGCKESGRDNSLLDCFGPVLKSTELSHQLRAAEQIFRFLNCAEDFQANEINVLLRSMQSTRLQDRLPWWTDVRACRRRSHRPWQRLALAKVFTTADESEEWAAKALLLRTRWSMAAQQLWPADAFRLMDTSNNGCLQLKELQVGLERLGVKRDGIAYRWDRQVQMLFHLLDKDDRKVLFIDDFRAALELGPEDWEAPKLDNSSDYSSHQQSPDRRLNEHLSADDFKAASPIKAIAAGTIDVDKNKSAARTASLQHLSPVAAAATPLRSARLSESPMQSAQIREGATPCLTPAIFTKLPAGRFKLKWQRHTAFRPLWSSGTVDDPLSIWTPIERVPKGKFLGVKRGSNAVKERVAAGHYINTSFSAPAGLSLLEVTDEQHRGFFAKHPRDELNRFMAMFFPHPVRFRQIWRRKENTSHRALYIWEAIPPSEAYVAAAMVFTQEDEAPAFNEIRCVPRAWAEKLNTADLVQVWTEAGDDGCPAGFWLARSIGNSQGLLHVTVGAAAHVAPEMHFLHPDSKKYYAALSQSE
eukprot:TRINITY_DN29551_c0_g1_i1.p1 TRINITY_DN29551_c0_g1~~TRINITY_DN29551_c0_g1_i1.p1  ORF type:complete len:4122 (-),score=701.34 TRINITY_DN29551_c0_g1_i1:256-12621(-)